MWEIELALCICRGAAVFSVEESRQTVSMQMTSDGHDGRPHRRVKRHPLHYYFFFFTCFCKNSYYIIKACSCVDCRSVDEVVSEHIFNPLERIILTFFLASIIIMTVLGNLLVMVALSRDRQLRWGHFLYTYLLPVKSLHVLPLKQDNHSRANL